MASFNGFKFELMLTDTEGWTELFPSKKYMVRRPVPFALIAGSSEIVQFLGVGNPTQKFTVFATDDALQQALEALWAQQQAGTLDLTDEFGVGFTYSNVILSDVGSKRRLPWETMWKIDVEFTQYA